MRRDPAIIREIMLAVQSAPANERPIVRIDDCEHAVVAEHVELLIEAGLLHGNVWIRQGPMADYRIERLTWAGHNYIEQEEWLDLPSIGEASGE